MKQQGHEQTKERHVLNLPKKTDQQTFTLLHAYQIKQDGRQDLLLWIFV